MPLRAFSQVELSQLHTRPTPRVYYPFGVVGVFICVSVCVSVRPFVRSSVRSSVRMHMQVRTRGRTCNTISCGGRMSYSVFR